SLVNGTFSEIKDRMFSHLPSLQLLFIEGNKIETISRNAFRGLRDLTHLSLANNHIKALPRDVFSDLDSLIELDLRGNKFECDCKAKWLYLWLKMTNSTVSDVLCIGPPEYQEKKLNDVTSFDYECTTTDFVVHQTLPYQSVSVDTFNSKNDVYVAIAQPSMENCMVLEWDHIEMNFRSYDNITVIPALVRAVSCWGREKRIQVAFPDTEVLALQQVQGCRESVVHPWGAELLMRLIWQPGEVFETYILTPRHAIWPPSAEPTFPGAAPLAPSADSAQSSAGEPVEGSPGLRTLKPVHVRGNEAREELTTRMVLCFHLFSDLEDR
ncbi:Leucine-rich repeat LGI family member 2, partial [Eschrichtius robustus]|nr:Leucine-rich repeat LGI family member 2 [Eschrichtius robustus]